MSKVSNKTASSLDKFTSIICCYPKAVLAMVFLITAAIASQLPNLKIEASTEAFFREDHPTLLKYREFQDQFGRGDVLIVGINPPEIFDLNFLKKLKAFHQDMENKVPHVKDVTSLVNARSTTGNEDELIVEDLMEEWPKNAEDLKILKK